MKKEKGLKNAFLFLGAALCFSLAACSDDEEGGAGGTAVGITAATVTPAGGQEYKCVVSQDAMTIENTSDSVDWDVSDAALIQATVKVTATLGCTVSCNGQEVPAEGVVADVTVPVTFSVSNASGERRDYTLKVVRATTASGEAMVRKGTSFNGFPTGILDWDMAYFQGKFYAMVTSLAGEQEKYQLFTSGDGLNWQEVVYQTSTAGVTLPEGQDGYVIGGEGARLVTFKERLYVLGGARTKGADKYGNESEMENGWTGPSPSLNEWRSYSTADGMTFECDTVGMTYYSMGGQPTPSFLLACTGMSVAELNGKLYMKSVYKPVFGTWQSGQVYAFTEDGKDWTGITPMSIEDSKPIAGILCDAFFSFKGKLWTVGGFTNFMDASNMTNAVYSSPDGENWTKEADLPEGMTNMFGMKAVAGEDVVYLFGGETCTAEGNDFAAQQIWRSADGVNWEAVAVPSNFTPRRNARGVLQGRTAWLFGGNTTPASGNYAYPADGDTYVYDTWVSLMK